MAIILYNLELNEDELYLLWAVLIYLDANPGPKPTHQTALDADKASKSALNKVERLMEGR